MKKIGILSDTHCTLIPQLFDFFKDVDELWHAGDIGSIETAEALASFKPLRAVHGNVDDHVVRMQYPGEMLFHVEDVDVYMTHIGGYPGHYMPEVKYILEETEPDLFICGHSHILKVMRDDSRNLLYVNPGAAGLQGWQIMRTALRFKIEGGEINNMEVFEIPKNSSTFAG